MREKKDVKMCKLGDGVVTMIAFFSCVCIGLSFRAQVLVLLSVAIPAEQMICLSRDFKPLVSIFHHKSVTTNHIYYILFLFLSPRACISSSTLMNSFVN